MPVEVLQKAAVQVSMNIDSCPTPIAVRPFKNLEEVIQIENTWTKTLELAGVVEALELASANIGTKVALAHAVGLLTDAVTCLRNASTIARRDGR